MQRDNVHPGKASLQKSHMIVKKFQNLKDFWADDWKNH